MVIMLPELYMEKWNESEISSYIMLLISIVGKHDVEGRVLWMTEK